MQPYKYLEIELSVYSVAHHTYADNIEEYLERVSTALQVFTDIGLKTRLSPHSMIYSLPIYVGVIAQIRHTCSRSLAAFFAIYRKCSHNRQLTV